MLEIKIVVQRNDDHINALFVKVGHRKSFAHLRTSISCLWVETGRDRKYYAREFVHSDRAKTLRRDLAWPYLARFPMPHFDSYEGWTLAVYLHEQLPIHYLAGRHEHFWDLA